MDQMNVVASNEAGFRALWERHKLVEAIRRGRKPALPAPLSRHVETLKEALWPLPLSFDDSHPLVEALRLLAKEEGIDTLDLARVLVGHLMLPGKHVRDGEFAVFAARLEALRDLLDLKGQELERRRQEGAETRGEEKFQGALSAEEFARHAVNPLTSKGRSEK